MLCLVCAGNDYRGERISALRHCGPLTRAAFSGMASECGLASQPGTRSVEPPCPDLLLRPRARRQHGYLHPKFFYDDGVSGTTFDRPGFKEMEE
ncbi:MAG: hypothetical protein K6C33_08840, partial [Desulfovibrio sp.]|nr:hypothetical protein [Desulfovibrio sp.]